MGIVWDYTSLSSDTYRGIGTHLEYIKTCDINGFLDPKNLLLDTEKHYPNCSRTNVKPLYYFGGHLGGHVEYLKMLNGDAVALLLK